MCAVFPETAGPLFDAELVTITAKYAGKGPFGGGVLFPVSDFHATPQPGIFGASAKPLKLAGAAPPLRELRFDHCMPQNMTAAPFALFLSPTTKPPPPG